MNKQETFDTVARHLLTQNERSRSDGDTVSCVYRGPRGLKCAIGVLIPDEMMSPRFNHDSVPGLPDKVLDNIIPDDIDRGEGISFLCKLARVHDCFDPREWKRELAEFAHDYNLSTDILEPSNIEDLVNDLDLEKPQEEMVPA